MMTISAYAKYDAATQEQIAAQCHDWRRYLQAHLTLLDARAGEGRIAFERAETYEERAAQAQGDLHSIPVARRATFDAVREERCQHLQSQQERTQRLQANGARPRPLDPDAIERQVLTELLAEAEGRVPPTDIPGIPEGWGMVPMEAAAGADRWWGVDVTALMDAPQAAAYEAGRIEADDRKRRLLLLAGLLLGAALLLIAWYLWPRGVSQPTPADAIPATINDSVVAPWPIQTLILLYAHQDGLATLPVSSTTALRWPLMTLQATPLALWRTSVLYPLTICVPANTLRNLTQIQLLSAGDLPTRAYVLREAAGVAPVDLIVEPCTPDQPASARRYGSLQATTLPPSLHLGETARISDEITVTLQAMQLLGPGDDPLLPNGQARLSVHVIAPSSIDWPSLAPTLLLPSSQALLPSETVATADGAELAYLVPLPSEPLEVAWSVSPTSQGSFVRWRTTLDVPPDRATILAQALTIQDATVIAAEHPGVVRLNLILRNQGRMQLQLQPADLMLTQEGRNLVVPDLAALRAPFAPDEARTISFDIPFAGR